MAEQLILLEAPRPNTRIDAHTRQLGLRGVAEARRVLTERIQAAQSAQAAEAAAAEACAPTRRATLDAA